MAYCFASVSKEEIISINEEAVPKNTKIAPNFGLTVFNSKLFNLSNHILSSCECQCALRGAQDFKFPTICSNFWSASYSACVVYTIKTIIHLSVGESGGYLPCRFAAR